MSPATASALPGLRARRDEHLDSLKELLAIPSVSTDPERAEDVHRAAEWVRARLARAGCTRVELHRTKGHPIVHGEWLGAPGAPTILVYGHYDVQPVDPLHLWQSPPFKPVVRDGRIHARGASDDKGQVLTHVLAFETWMAERGAAPVNLKFLIEGEEEIGSENLEPFVASHAAELAADAVLISDTAMLGPGVPSICYGLRGLAYLELTVRATDRDLHSGTFGGATANPANVLAEMLAQLHDRRGRVTIPGFYDRVRRPTARERREMGALPHSDARFGRAIGARKLTGETGWSTLERTWVRPTLDVNGVWGGFTGEGAKTVIPAEAHAKISMRLVPDQRHPEIARLATAHLKRLAPPTVTVTVRELHGGPPWITSTEHPALQAAARALRRAFGKKSVFVREGGSIPIVAAFEKRLGIPSVLMGFGLNDDNLHAPNEKLDLEQFWRGIEASAAFMEEIASDGTPAPPSTAGKRRPSRRRAARA